MAVQITAELVSHIAKLARLRLSEAEIARFTDQLGAILRHIEQLSEIDVSGVPPLTPDAIRPDALRLDEPHTCLPPADALRNAPQRIDDFFRVPAVLEGGA